MSREFWIGKRAYHEDSGHRGTILEVHLDVRPQTALFHHDETAEDEANWVNLEKLKFAPKEEADEGG